MALVLGVEKARIAHGDDRRFAAAFERCAVEFEPAALREAAAQFLRFRPRQQHGVAKMRAAGALRQHMGQQQALIDLGAVLVALRQAVLAADLRRIGHEAGHDGGGIADQILDALEFRETVGQAAVDRLDVSCREISAARRGRAAGSRLRPRLRLPSASALRGRTPASRRRYAIAAKTFGIAAVIAGERIVALARQAAMASRGRPARPTKILRTVFVACIANGHRSFLPLSSSAACR